MKEKARQRKGRIKDRRAVFFQILLSHHNNHLTALCGLAAACDVERERERGELMRLDSDQSRTIQRSTLVDLPPLLPALPYRSVTDCAHSVRSTAKLGLYCIQIRSNAKHGLYRSTAKHGLYRSTAKPGLYRSTAKPGLYTDRPQS